MNNILDFSRINENDLVLRFKPVDIYMVTEYAIKLIRPLVGEKNLEIRNNLDHRLQMVHADEDRLKQILNNLLGKTVKFIESGVVDIDAKLIGNVINNKGEQSEKIEIRVYDTGIGIHPGNLEKIFNSFE